METTFALSCFGGVRGWDIHDAELGLSTTSLDNDPAATDTAHANGPGSGPALLQDIRTFHLEPGHPYRIGKFSPPCGAFTVAGSGAGRKIMRDLITALYQMRDADGVPWWIKGRHDDAALVLEPMRLIREAIRTGSPFRGIAMEQTREVLPIWSAYANILPDYGYNVAVGVLKAEQYAVPQARRRAVLVASLERDVSLPPVTHSPYRPGGLEKAFPAPGLQGWVPMATALGLRDRFTPIASLRSNYGTGGDASNRGVRQYWQPAPTITRKYNRNKWLDDRGRMDDRDAATLQTFPTDYVWPGKATETQLQIGNAIPPLLAKAILEQVI